MFKIAFITKLYWKLTRAELNSWFLYSECISDLGRIILKIISDERLRANVKPRKQRPKNMATILIPRGYNIICPIVNSVLLLLNHNLLLSIIVLLLPV